MTRFPISLCAILAACSAETDTQVLDQIGAETPSAPVVQQASEPSSAYAKVDRSFSDIPIDSIVFEVQDQLTAIGSEDCFEDLDCEWHDDELVRHYFWTDGHDEPWLVVKSVSADEVGDASIGALGIGLARSKADVLANVRNFAPELDIRCETEGREERCGSAVLPGWIRIWFDEEGMLREVRFDGYQFT